MRKVKYKKGNIGDECGSDEEKEVSSRITPKEGQEEAKVTKTGNKRGRPRKNPTVVKDEISNTKSKRGRKPKKVYDIGPIGAKLGMDVSFNGSDNDENSIEDNEPQEKEIQEHIPPFYPRKESMNNPFDKFFNAIPKNMDYINHNRSRMVSSDLSPYNIPSNPPNLQSPADFRINGLHNHVDFKSNKPIMMNNNQNGTPQQHNDDNPLQKKLNDIIAQSFKDWNKPRKDTIDIDFNAGSVMSPDYKPRSFSINSGNWNMAPHNMLEEKQRGRTGWDFDSSDIYLNEKFGKGNQEENRNPKNGTDQPRVIKVSTFKRKESYRNGEGALRKNTMVEHPKTIKQTSPLFFPKFGAAFRPVKKRAHSLHTAPKNNMPMNEGGEHSGQLKKRDQKAEQKAGEDE